MKYTLQKAVSCIYSAHRSSAKRLMCPRADTLLQPHLLMEILLIPCRANLQAYALACKKGNDVQRESRLRAGLFMAQYQIMYADTIAAIDLIQVKQMHSRPPQPDSIVCT